MSAATTTPAFVHHGDFDEETRSHPAMKWMENWTHLWDGGRTELNAKLIASDFSYTKRSGESFPVGKESFEAVVKDYSMFTSRYHEPYLIVCYDSPNGGWEMIGNAWLYVNLPGQSSVNGDKANHNVKDLRGRDWDMRVPGGFYFIYEKDENKEGGIALKNITITSDSGPVVVELLKRGWLRLQELGL